MLRPKVQTRTFTVERIVKLQDEELVVITLRYLEARFGRSYKTSLQQIVLEMKRRMLKVSAQEKTTQMPIATRHALT